MNKSADNIVDQEALNRGHEVVETNVGLVIKFGVGLTLMTIFSALLMWAMFEFVDDYQSAQFDTVEPLIEADQIPPEPRLQVIPEVDLAILRAEEKEMLESYGWVVRTAGIVRIPVEKAIELSLERAETVFPSRTQTEVE